MYIDKLNEIIEKISPDLINFEEERKHSTPPTQVSSEFLTNKEQGDWAEKTLINCINNNSKNLVAVKYGCDDRIIAGDAGFKDFYENYQKELDTIGKRPDILIFDKKDFPYKERNICSWSVEKCEKLVPRAKCGIEVRSSAFLFDKYENYMQLQQENYILKAMQLKSEILTNFSKNLKTRNPELYKIIEMIDLNNIHVISFRACSYSSTPELKKMSKLIKELKSYISKISKRTFLSITPKVEDLKVVYNWCRYYNVPHYYVQVFFDKAYGISFEKILSLLANPSLENKEYFIEGDVKNQNKITIKIHANTEKLIMNKIILPKHHSKMLELNRGRLLFYVEFEHSIATLDRNEFQDLFKVTL